MILFRPEEHACANQDLSRRTHSQAYVRSRSTQASKRGLVGLHPTFIKQPEVANDVLVDGKARGIVHEGVETLAEAILGHPRTPIADNHGTGLSWSDLGRN